MMTQILWPGALNSPETAGRLTINGVDMHNQAWNVLDLVPLWMYEASRGANVIIPGASGRRAYPRRVDEGRYSLPMIITGVADRLGVGYANRWTGLQTNLAYLHTNVVNPPTAPTATRAATLLMPDGTTRNADVQVESLDIANPGTTAAVIQAVLELVIPAGRFV